MLTYYFTCYKRNNNYNLTPSQEEKIHQNMKIVKFSL